MSSVIINQIRNNYLFTDVDFEQLQLNEDDFELKYFEPGKFVFKKDDVAERFFFIAYGKVVLFSENEKLKFIDNSFLGAELVNSETYKHSAVAEDSSLLLTMEKEQFLSLLEQNQTLKENLVNWENFAVDEKAEKENAENEDDLEELLDSNSQTDLSSDENDLPSENIVVKEKIGKDNLEIAELISSVYYKPIINVKNTLQKLKEIESDADTEKVVTKLAKQVQTIEDASYNAKVFAGIKNEVQLEKVNLNDIFYELTEIIYDRFSVLPELFVPEECNLDLAKDDFLEAVKQVVFNSCESIGEDVIVKISATCSDEYAEVLIEDNGAGIPNESIDDIFDPFFSFGKQNHIGLGLSIADKIISNLAGKIAVKKTSGDGTVFSILLPLPVE